MTKAELRRVFGYYGDKLVERTVSGKLRHERMSRMVTKLSEWERQLTRVTLRNGSAVRYSVEEVGG